jgi:hypothetical protein
MNKIRICKLVCIFAVLCLCSIAIAKFQHHEVGGKLGTSEVRLAWYTPNQLKGYISGGAYRHADYSWAFLEDFNKLKIVTKAATGTTSYTLTRKENIYQGTAPSAFGMGVDVELRFYSDSVKGVVGVDEIDMKIDPPLTKGEIPGLDWIFEGNK